MHVCVWVHVCVWKIKQKIKTSNVVFCQILAYLITFWQKLETATSFKHLGCYNWWGCQAWDILQDSTDNSSTDKVETSLKWQEYFSHFQDATDVLPCHIHLPVCLWIMDPHSKAPKKNESHGNERLLQDTTHFSQRQCHKQGSPCQDLASNRTTRRPPDHIKRRKLQWYGHVSRSSDLAKTILQGTVKGGRRQGRQRKRWEDNIREWTGLAFGKFQKAVENKRNRENWLQNLLWCPNDPRG